MKCKVCGAETKNARRLCKRHVATEDKRAQDEQERAYLASWLSSRVNEYGTPFEDSALCATSHDRRIIERRIRLARKLGVDWTTPPSLKKAA